LIPIEKAIIKAHEQRKENYHAHDKKSRKNEKYNPQLLRSSPINRMHIEISPRQEQKRHGIQTTFLTKSKFKVVSIQQKCVSM
jgi:hypothetical protein